MFTQISQKKAFATQKYPSFFPYILLFPSFHKLHFTHDGTNIPYSILNEVGPLSPEAWIGYKDRK